MKQPATIISIFLSMLCCALAACGTWIGNPDDEEIKFVGVQPTIVGIEPGTGEALTALVLNGDGSKGSFAFDSVYLAVESLELLQKNAIEDGAYSAVASVEGPFLLDIINGNIYPNPNRFEVPVGTYDGVRLVSSVFSEELLAPLETKTSFSNSSSIALVGTYEANGAKIAALLQIPSIGEIVIAQPIEISGAQNLDLSFKFNPSGWFDFSGAEDAIGFQIFSGQNNINAERGQANKIDLFLEQLSKNFSASINVDLEINNRNDDQGPSSGAGNQDDGNLEVFPDKEGLGGYWKLNGSGAVLGINGSILDSSGYDNHGTAMNFTGNSSYVSGKLNEAILFDGYDDYITVGKPASFSTTGAMTLMAWVKVHSEHSGMILARSSSRTIPAAGYRLFTAVDAAGLHFAMGISSNGSDVINVVSTENFLLNEWYLVSGVYEPSKALRIYINGTLAGELKTGIPDKQFIPENYDLLIGKRNNSQRFDGTIDEVSVWNRVLTQPEIKTIFDLQSEH